VLAFWGAQLAGAVVVPVNTRFKPAEVDYVVEDSGATLVVDPDHPAPEGDPHAVDDLGPGDLAAIFYTSGTTGFGGGRGGQRRASVAASSVRERTPSLR
jgi:long-chain acyl-CoA synthetase